MSTLRIDIKQIGAVIRSSGLAITTMYRGLSSEEYDFAPVLLITKEGLAKKRENLGPSWPKELGDAVLYLAPETKTDTVPQFDARLALDTLAEAAGYARDTPSDIVVAAALLALDKQKERRAPVPAPGNSWPMAWPLLDAEGLARYLERYTPEALRAAARASSFHTVQDTLAPILVRDTPPQEDHVRVLRVIEYTGPRALVERQVERSLHGTRLGVRNADGYFLEPSDNSPVRITAVTLGEYPEVLERAKLAMPAPVSRPVPVSIDHKAHPSEPAIHGDALNPCLCVIGCTVNSDCPVHGDVGPR